MRGATRASVAGTRKWAGLAIALALPAAGLALLVARPELDVEWRHQPIHFWLVLGTAALSVALAMLTNEAASRRADARIVLVSLAFLLAAGFLGLHAVATPGVLIPSPNAGFAIATPVGLALASVAAAASASPLAGPRSALVLRHRVALRRGVLGLLLAWGIASLLGLPPLSGPPTEETNEVGAVAAMFTVGLYGFAAWRYVQIARRRGSRFAVVVAASLVLLAEAMLAVAVSRGWHLSWWEWHVLMTAAFALIALGARTEYRRTGSLVATFEPIYLEATLERLDRWHGRAIAELAAASESDRERERVLDSLRREGASVDELRLMDEAAHEIRRVDALFRPYLPQRYAERLRTGEGPAADRERVVSVLFADLAGFTSFSERHAPMEVIGMLNAFWAAAVPVIDALGGAIEHFAGDGILVVFNAEGDQPDHADRAARCGTALIREADRVAAGHPGWPRFRVGIATGPAAVGTVGAGSRRSFATIGDTTNLAARIMALAEPGQVVIGPETRAALGGDGFSLVPLGSRQVKGKRQPVETWAVGPVAAP